MSRLTGNEVQNLMEAYAAVYAPQELTEEQIWEEVESWVNSLLEEGYDLSEYTWEEMFEAYITEDETGQAGRQAGAQARQVFGQARRAYGDVAGAYGQGFLGQKTTSSNPLARLGNTVSRTVSAPSRALGSFAQGFVTGKPGGSTPVKSTPSSSTGIVQAKKGGVPGVLNKGTGEWKSAESITGIKVPNVKDISKNFRMPGGTERRAPTPSAPTPRTQAPASNPPKLAAPKPGTSAPAAPAAPAGQTGDKAKDMATWAKANPKLAAAADEKARIRGTQQTDNPLMKDMRSRLPMRSPSVQSPDVAKLGKGNQSLVNNPNALKAAAPKPATPAAAAPKPVTPTQAIKAAPSTSASASGSVAPATAAIAATPKPTPVAPAGGPKTRAQVLGQSYEYDAYDLVLEYLLSEGHVETVDEALYVMMEMDSETIQSICESAKRDPKKVRGAKDPVAYMKGRSDAGKRISGDEYQGPASYTLRGRRRQEPTQPGARPQHTPRLSDSEREEVAMRRANLKRR